MRKKRKERQISSSSFKVRLLGRLAIRTAHIAALLLLSKKLHCKKTLLRRKSELRSFKVQILTLHSKRPVMEAKKTRMAL